MLAQTTHHSCLTWLQVRGFHTLYLGSVTCWYDSEDQGKQFMESVTKGVVNSPVKKTKKEGYSKGPMLPPLGVPVFSPLQCRPRDSVLWGFHGDFIKASLAMDNQLNFQPLPLIHQPLPPPRHKLIALDTSLHSSGFSGSHMSHKLRLGQKGLIFINPKALDSTFTFLSLKSEELCPRKHRLGPKVTLCCLDHSIRICKPLLTLKKFSLEKGRQHIE